MRMRAALSGYWLSLSTLLGPPLQAADLTLCFRKH